MALSVEFKIALVAGLIEEGNVGGPGYSSAYLIDGQRCHLLTRKMQNDGSNNYKPCTEDCDISVEYRSASLAALLCMDAADFSERDGRHAAVLERMASRETAQRILCVPAHMMTYGSKKSRWRGRPALPSWWRIRRRSSRACFGSARRRVASRAMRTRCGLRIWRECGHESARTVGAQAQRIARSAFKGPP